MKKMQIFSLLSRRLTTGFKGYQKIVKLGNVRVNINNTERLELVPARYLEAQKHHSQEILSHLKWLLQKDILKQDVFLLGVPGSMRSKLVLQYLELRNREYEYIAVTRDTTEADIKQRREIRGGTAFYTDLCAVRAALHGRVLVIDGVEKAERNVLPILNNLLENREMQLDDGRFLMHPEKYDKLRSKYSIKELQDMGIERVSEDFHVIALGLPVPRFPGHTLDPPFRSRFQCRNVKELEYETTLRNSQSIASSVVSNTVNNLISLIYAINSQNDMGFPRIPIDNIEQVMRIWNLNPSYSAEAILQMLYPMKSVLRENEIKIFHNFLEEFKVKDNCQSENMAMITGVRDVDNEERNIEISIDYGEEKLKINTSVEKCLIKDNKKFIRTQGQEILLTDLAIAHSQGDFALIGPKGSGKTIIIDELAKRLKFRTETMMLYQDMNSRELLQRRRMLENGDTVWEDSQLVAAAKRGSVCILDGAERVHWSALESLASLCHHRHLDLPGGGRLIGSEEFRNIMQKTGLDEEHLNSRGVYCIPPSFRLLLVGDSECFEHRWINEAILSLMPFYTLKPLTINEQCKVIESLVPGENKTISKTLVSFVDKLRASHDSELRAIASSLSLRKLIHISRRNILHGGELRGLLEKAALAKFLPSITRTAFSSVLEKAGISNDTTLSTDILVDLESLQKHSISKDGDEAMIPDVLFYDNEQHLSVMRDMARDMELGAHLLLIGNQGVGKNKITDRFLHLINRPRQYMQLHRDTTVESLTIQMCVENGVLRHEDSALVRAVRAGHILVVDEADKAPLHVIAIFKSLIDSGTLILGDGRCIQPSSFPPNEKVIPLHPDFRIIMLANRPGFPFLGNDLFGVLGDLFSVHTVDNPSRDSELEMLRKYAPNVSEDCLTKLIASFGELRVLADEGQLNYPYSTRELVNIVKHANQFPDDPLPVVVKNVFDFDEFSTDTVKMIEELFQKHGIPLGVDRPDQRVFLSHRHAIDPWVSLGKWGINDGSVPIPIEIIKSGIKMKCSNFEVSGKSLALAKEHMRSNQFTEQECAWQIPMLDVNICTDGLLLNDILVIATVNPPRLYMIRHLETTNNVKEVDISPLISSVRQRSKFQPKIRLTSFSNSQILLHEEVSNSLFLFDLRNMKIETIDIGDSLLKNITNSIFGENNWRLVNCEQPIAILFQRDGRRVITLDSEKGMIDMELPHQISSIFSISLDRLLVKFQDSSLHLLTSESGQYYLYPLDFPRNQPFELESLRVDNKSVYMAADNFYCLKTNGFPLVNTSAEVLASIRHTPSEVIDERRPYYLSDQNTKKYIDSNCNMIVMQGGIVIRSQPKWNVPKNSFNSDILNIYHVGGFLEVVDPNNGFIQYVPVPEPKYKSYHGSWLANISKTPFIMVPWNEKKMLTLDTCGGIRSFELSLAGLSTSFSEWKKMIGGNDNVPLRLEIDRKPDDFDIKKLDEPKIGKFDPSNAPHHGGNTWMGGTGGYNTAGLGGVGGPFRLDAGHDVHQMPEFAKQQVPDHILKRAREIAKAEYQKKLKEIQMSEYDADAYDSLWKKIEKQSERLRSIIEQLKAMKKERQWMRHQTSGDFDDGKLIEGMTGEKNIYRRRIDKLPEPGTPQIKPKKMRLCFDISGSMYRFNGHDKRLQKSLEAALMVMSSLEGQDQKIKYDITGHSGDGPCLNFVVNGNTPKNNKERLDILKQMLAHTQFCASGDYTIEALDMAIKELAKEEDCDEKFVVLVSDANLERYGIRPNDIVRVMSQDEAVKCFVIFIGSLGEQANRLQKALPAGKAFVCKDTSELPSIMQNIFASTLV